MNKKDFYKYNVIEIFLFGGIFMKKIIKELIISVLLSLILMLILSILVSETTLSEKFINPLTIAIVTFSLMLGAFRVSKEKKERMKEIHKTSFARCGDTYLSLTPALMRQRRVCLSRPARSI